MTTPVPASDSGVPDLDALAAQLGLSPELQARIRRGATEADQSWVVVASALGLVDDRAVARALAARYGLPCLSRIDASSPPEGVKLPALQFLRVRKIVPFGLSAGQVDVAVADPADTGAVRALTTVTGAPARLHVASLSDIDATLDRLAGGGDAEGFASIGGLDEVDALIEASALRDLADRAPVIRLVDQLCAEALDAGASDLHLECMREHLDVRLRVDGVLHLLRRLPRGAGPVVSSRLKVLAGMDVANRRSPQDGRASLTVRGRNIDARFSCVPGLHGETVTVRFLDRTAANLDLGTLGFSTPVADALTAMAGRSQGLLLVTGPTGHGKTTTLYALLKCLNDGTRKILTIEDPVEYGLDGVTQVQVNEAAGVTFAGALRAFLRQDPDVLLVGEIRDGETARIAGRAALTGHLVLATLHTNDAPSAVTRLRDMGLEPYLIAGVLAGVVAQRLVRRLCSCAIPDDRETVIADIRAALGDCKPTDLCIRRSRGCPACRGSGFNGRLAIAEAFAPVATDRALIADGDEDALRAALSRQGFRPMIEDGAARVGLGETDWSEILRVTG